jgi:hypothetical protein
VGEYREHIKLGCIGAHTRSAYRLSKWFVMIKFLVVAFELKDNRLFTFPTLVFGEYGPFSLPHPALEIFQEK